MNGHDLHLPPGFRFHPTDEELVSHYLCRKCATMPIAVPIIAEVDLYKHDPWQLPAMALYGEKEWYFFSPRDRKYPNGSRPNRAAGSGYWKATGADKPIGGAKPVAIKKALVFYAGKAPKGEKSNWIMHEYRLADVDRSARRKNSLRLDDWVLCRIYNKKGSAEKSSVGPDIKPAGLKSVRPPANPQPDQKPGAPAPSHVLPPNLQQFEDMVYFDVSDSTPRLHADSSSSGPAASPEFAAEVQSRPKWGEWEMALDAQLNHEIALPRFDYGSGFRDPLQDIFMHLQKPF